ncbi:uncharacterized protein LOC135847618 isoform X3 [Planococcus citri]|uniref:uncharacterized protein LOC135847618 isoform X3 n=1 Tax=Planococcus citri TaxID=170843 RepID=UPI0031FA05B7
MDEIVPVVYDIAQPTPVSLKDLSAIAISLEIWRNEIRKHRTNDTLGRFDPLTLNISSKTVLPDLPSVIYDVVDEYISRFGPSMDDWLSVHFNSIFDRFDRHDDYANSVLEDFDDFVADYSGTIHYVRTAKRMMVCDRFSEDEKFAIACMYFFEDDITRIWPSVCESESFDFDRSTDLSDFEECSQLYYWTCRLNDDLDEIPIDEFEYHMVENRSSLEYFWDRVPHLENRMRKAIDTYNHDIKLFVTFVLSKLNDQQLDEFVSRNGCDLILNLLDHDLCNYWFLEPTWNFIKNKMSESNLRTLVIKMLKFEQKSAFKGCSSELRYWMYNCSVIWNSITPDLKRSIVENILSDTRVFENTHSFPRSRRFVGFLLLVLSSATFEQRRAFWRDSWPHLIEGTRSEDLLGIMKLCFENDEEIAQIKDSILAKSENVHNVCSKLLSFGMFEELNDLLNFYWPEVQAAKDYKLQLLRSTFLGEKSGITLPLVKRVGEFRVFIDDTFNNKDQSSEFKNQLMSSPSTPDNLSSYPCLKNPPIETLITFVDRFASAEDTKRVIKERMIRRLKEFVLINRECRYDRRFETKHFERFLSWLLGSFDLVGSFKWNHLKCDQR